MSGPEQEGSDDELDAARIMRLLERFNVQADHFVACAGESQHLHRSDLRALSVLRAAHVQGSHASPGALAAALNLSTPATSALLDRLSRSGHVVRRRAASDGRRIELDMTDSAISLAVELFAPLRDRLVPQIDSFSPQERAVIARFLVAVTDATERATTVRS